MSKGRGARRVPAPLEIRTGLSVESRSLKCGRSQENLKRPDSKTQPQTVSEALPHPFCISSLLPAPQTEHDRATIMSKKVTEFQTRVYALLQQIPEGKITSYAAMAKALDSSPRAVGGALRNNPFAPEVPCHRCIASTGVSDAHFPSQHTNSPPLWTPC